MINGIDLMTAAATKVEPFKLDISITVAVVVALMSLISPIVVARINNNFQSRQRDLERKYELEKRERELRTEMEKQRTEYDYKIQIHKYDSYYKNQTMIFEQLFNDVGDYLSDKENLDKYSAALSGIYKAQAYADGKLASEMKHLWGDTVMTVEGETQDERKNAHDNALSQLSKVASMMNSILKQNAKIDT